MTDKAPTRCKCGGYFKRSKKKRNIYYCSFHCGNWYNINDYKHSDDNNE